MAGTIVVCQTCGQRMVIPPGFEHHRARCRTCNSELSASQPAQEQTLTADLLDMAPRAAKPPSPPIQKTSPSERVMIIAKSVCLWGLASSLSAGCVLAVIGHLVTSLFSISKVSGGTAGLSFGLTVGFLFGGMWGAIFKAEMNLLPAVLLGVVIGIPLCAINLSTMVPRDLVPEMGAFEYVFLGAAGGGMTPLLLSLFRRD